MIFSYSLYQFTGGIAKYSAERISYCIFSNDHIYIYTYAVLYRKKHQVLLSPEAFSEKALLSPGGFLSANFGFLSFLQVLSLFLFLIRLSPGFLNCLLDYVVYYAIQCGF